MANGMPSMSSAGMGELFARLRFVLIALLIYRIGTHIPVPGIDPEQLASLFDQNQGTILGLANVFSGGALERMSILALGILPYISASIIMQLMTAVTPQLEQLKKEGEAGRRKISQWTRYLTVVLALVQGTGMTVGLANQGLTYASGLSFYVTAVASLVTGAVFMMWLGEQITERGLGNGASLLIFFSIVERFIPGIFQTFSFVSTGAVSLLSLIGMTITMVLVVAGTVAMTLAARRIAFQIPQRTMARGRQRASNKDFIPLRINTAGVMPIIFAQSIIVVPGAIAQFSGNPALAQFSELFAPGTWLYFTLSAVLIMFFTYFYTSIIFNPVDLAENLKKQGAFIPGIKPGSKTAEYIDHVVSRITLPGAAFLTVIALLPIWLADIFGVPFQFGGTSLLIVVGVALDTMAQMQNHLLQIGRAHV